MSSEQAEKIIALLERIDEKLNLALGLQPTNEIKDGAEIIEAMNAEKEHCCE